MGEQATTTRDATNTATVVTFDYQAVAAEHRKALREDARQIRKRLVETAVGLMEIGERLHRARELLPHGTWLPWLVCETGMSEQWSRNCIDVFLRFREAPSLFSELDVALAPTAVIRLATAPDAAYEEIVNRVRAGERLRVVDVEETIRKFREVDGPETTVRFRSPGKKEVEAGRIAAYQVVQARPVVVEIVDVAFRLDKELKCKTPNLRRLQKMVETLKRNTIDIQMAFSDHLATQALKALNQDGLPPDTSTQKTSVGRGSVL